MKKEQEELILSMSLGFKKILKKNNSFIIFQLILDLYIFSEFLMNLISSFYALPFTILVLIIIKAFLTIFKRNVKSCYVCIILNIVTIIFAIAFKIIDYNTIVALVISLMIFVLRIKQCHLTEKISCIYGFPHFNSLIMLSELQYDEKLCNDVIYQYEMIENDAFLQNELKQLNAGIFIKALKYIGILVAVVGLIIMSNGCSSSKNPDKSIEISNIDTADDGLFVSGVIDKIYCMTATGMNKGIADCYWCEFNDKCITFEVPDYYKEKFALLYNHYAEQQEMLLYDGCADVIGSSSDAIEFKGIIRKLDKYDTSIINKKALKNKKTENIVTDMYIELVDPEASDNLIYLGVFLIVIGSIAYVFTIMSVWYKNE